jgi:hypothetical protein
MNSEVSQWLGRAYVLVKASHDLGDTIQFKKDIDNFQSEFFRSTAVLSIHQILYRALATAELAAPAGSDGTFIPVGNSFDAFSALSKILGNAKKDVLIIDPYMDEVTLTEFGTTVPENINLRLMADQKDSKATLLPAAQSWVKQYSTKRPLSVRLARSTTVQFL